MVNFYKDLLWFIDDSLDEVPFKNKQPVKINGNTVMVTDDVVNIRLELKNVIKYLHSEYLWGNPIPATIILVSFKKGLAQIFNAEEYIDYIEENDKPFFVRKNPVKWDYDKDASARKSLIKQLKNKDFAKITINVDNARKWCREYYRLYPSAGRDDFLEEIQKPDIFAKYLRPFAGELSDLSPIMDQLHNKTERKNTGSFYTPLPYAKQAQELLEMAIARVPPENDYVVIDRCAGIGNLEAGLDPSILSRCILNTLDQEEWEILNERFKDKVKYIFPPTDAFDEAFVKSPIFEECYKNRDCTIIIFENPPYSYSNSIEHQKDCTGSESNVWKHSWLPIEMTLCLKNFSVKDKANVFIWSAFNNYMRQHTDSLIVIAPPGYWKKDHLIKKRFIDGYAFNRKHFNTNTNSCLLCALWANEEWDNEKIVIGSYNIVDGELVNEGDKEITKVHEIATKAYYDKRPIPEENRKGILCGLNGLEYEGNNGRERPARGGDIIGYLRSDGYTYNNPELHSNLTVGGLYAQCGFYLRKDNFLEKLPLFAASRYCSYFRQWHVHGRAMKSGDGKAAFEKDLKNGLLNVWLKKCLIFTALCGQNHIREFVGSDGYTYRNELCLDGDTLASRIVRGLKKTKSDWKILNLWNTVLKEAKKTENYNPQWHYGVYQIQQELNTKHKKEKKGREITVYDNPRLNEALINLRNGLKSYYITEIAPNLRKYKFVVL